MRCKDFLVSLCRNCVLIFFIMIFFLIWYQQSYAATIYLNCGQTIRDSKSKNYYKAPACPTPCPTQKPCPSCPPPTVCPSPAPSPVPSPSPVTGRTVETICSMYVDSNRDSATTSDLDRANKMRGYCSIVFTWWKNLPQQTWCPYIMQNSTVKACGPYDNDGYIWKSDPVYTNYIVPQKPNWILKNSSGTPVGDMWDSGKTKTVVNMGFPEARQWFIDYFKSPPPGAVWTGTHKDRAWNARWLDDFALRPISNNVWDMAPIDAATGNTLTNDVWQGYRIQKLRALRVDADANGILLVANLLGDPFWTNYPNPNYTEPLNLIDYGVFEILVTNLDRNPVPETEWIRRIKNFQWIAKNSRAIPVGTTEYGDFYYNLATVLLVCEPGRCAIWQQPIMTDSQIAKIKALDLGTQVSDFTKTGCYIRPWTKGLVIANPTDSSCSVPLSGSYTDLETGATLSGNVAVTPKKGKVMSAVLYGE